MTSPLLAVGVGNTTVKLGVTEDRDQTSWPVWKSRHELPTATFKPEDFAGQLPDEPVEWCVVSVQRQIEKALREWIDVHRSADEYRLLTYRDLPIEVQVDAPDRVGLDRLAAAVAANRLRDARPAVVIDAGTALTVNWISQDGAFQGGVILPGFSLTAKALSAGTDLLPLVMADLNAEPPPVIGKSTEEAIRSGLFWGNVGAVREIVQRISAQSDQLPQIFVTGGDARRLSGFISPEARFVSDLVLAGIVFSVT